MLIMVSVPMFSLLARAHCTLWTKARLITRVEGILTQLIFNRAMQVRSSTDNSNATGTLSQEHDDEETLANTASSQRDDQAGADASTKSSSTHKGFSFGNLNNLIATDIANIDSGQYWIMTGMICYNSSRDNRWRDVTIGFFNPVQIIVSIVFLYIVLGWRYARSPASIRYFLSVIS